MRIFYDVDTQNDFMNSSGALYVPGAEEIKENLRELAGYAVNKGMPVIASVDRHFGTEKYAKREADKMFEKDISDQMDIDNEDPFIPRYE